MTGLVRTELFKICTTRTGRGMLALTLGFVLCPLTFLIPTAGAGGDNGLPPLSDPDMVRTQYGSATSGTTFVLILGILGMTGECRPRTLTQVFLQTPRRDRVIAAKIVAYSITGAAFGVASVLLVAAVALPAMAAKGGPVSLLVHDVPVILGGAVLACLLFALIGLGVGALIRNQVAAIAVAVGWLGLSELVIAATVPTAARWLPGGALQALVEGNAGLTAVEIPRPAARLGRGRPAAGLRRGVRRRGHGDHPPPRHHLTTLICPPCGNRNSRRTVDATGPPARPRSTGDRRTRPDQTVRGDRRGRCAVVSG